MRLSNTGGSWTTVFFAVLENEYIRLIQLTGPGGMGRYVGLGGWLVGLGD